jgi:hypothetical protein
VQETLVLARRALIIPEAWVADMRAPEPEGPIEYDGAHSYAAAIKAEIERANLIHLQDGQPVHVEVLCEAADLQPRLARVAAEKGV